jgi:hypothetical protein
MRPETEVPDPPASDAPAPTVEEFYVEEEVSDDGGVDPDPQPGESPE